MVEVTAAGVLMAGVTAAAQETPGQAAGVEAHGAEAASLGEARRMMAVGRFEDAAARLEVLVNEQPNSAAAHEMLAYSRLRLNDPKRSLEQYTQAAAIARPSPADLQNVAKDYMLLGDTASADHWMSVALKMDTKDAEAWYGMGRIRFTEQRFQEAADCFERSLTLLPRGVKAENNLGLAYEGLNRPEEAIAAYRQAIAWQQGDAHPSEQPLLNLGILLERQQKLAEAEQMLTQAAAIAPRDGRIREQLGQVYLDLKRLPEAQTELEAAIALDPKKASLHFLLGRVLHLEGESARSKAEFDLAAGLSGTHATPEGP